MLCLGAGASDALGAGAGGGVANGRAGSPSGAFSSGLSGAMSTISGSPRLAYNGMLKVFTQSNDPSRKMWNRTEQTIAIAMARCAGSAGSGILTIADYATPGVRAPSRPIASREWDKPCTGPLANDVPGPREVSRQNEHTRVDVALDEFAAGHGRALRIGAKPARPLRLRHLHGAVHEITGEHGVTRSRRQTDRDVAGRVTW